MANYKKVKLGFVPTRRNVFSKEEAIKYKDITKSKLLDMEISFVDLEWLNDEGLLFDVNDVEKVEQNFKAKGVDALFIPHCNFGSEYVISKLAKKMGLPVLIWGPRDDMPLPNGSRTRDSQCGLFASSKVLNRFGVKFSYITSCKISDPIFEKGIDNFIRTASVVKDFKNIKIGQIGTRPGDFWSVISNEGELLEKFGVETIPITLVEISNLANSVFENKKKYVMQMVEQIKAKVRCEDIDNSGLAKLASFKIAIKDWAEENQLSAVAIQCWTALQDITGLMPCFINGELTSEGLPVVCETDIAGAVSAVIGKAANLDEDPIFFADLTIRHPENDNAELLWHCGNFPLALADDENAYLGRHDILPEHCPGVGNWKITGDDITLLRFDGMHGEYSMLMGHSRGIKGPKNTGTYIWVETDDWPLWEEKIIYGPYIHHIVGVSGKLAPVLYEACKYIEGVKPDPVLPTEQEIKEYLRR